MNETHLDIFSGLGGFALAAREAGFRTVAFCESDSRCRDFLEKTWSLPVESDIRKLDGRKYAGVSLLTGGPPCQPASRAGKQGGAGDDRWLWNEALRVLEEAKPDCVVFENPPGIADLAEFRILPPVDGSGAAIGNIGDTFHHDGFGVLDKILGQIESFGYETQPFDIPACGVDSPQLRHRIWIVGFLGNAENGSRRLLQRCERRPDSDIGGPTSNMADAERQRRERRSAESREEEGRQSFGAVAGLHWSDALWVPCADGKLRRAPDDSFSLVDGLHRSILGALGNSIVPQVAVEILKAIKTQLEIEL